MKKILSCLLLATLLAISMTSCAKDELAQYGEHAEPYVVKEFITDFPVTMEDFANGGFYITLRVFYTDYVWSDQMAWRPLVRTDFFEIYSQYSSDSILIIHVPLIGGTTYTRYKVGYITNIRVFEREESL